MWNLFLIQCQLSMKGRTWNVGNEVKIRAGVMDAISQIWWE